MTYPDSHDEGSVKLLGRYIDEFVDWCRERGLKTVQSITDAHCQDYLDFRRKGIAKTTLKTVRGYISGLFTRAVKDKLIAANPWAHVKVGKGVKQEKTPRFWTEGEIMRIVAACRQQWHKDLVIVLANTGIRISATLAMKWDWIDWHDGCIMVPAKHNKGGTKYKVAITHAAHDVLARRHAESKHAYVFPHEDTGERYTYAGGADPIERAIKKSKVPRGTPHDLRHTFGRWLHLQGVPQAVISRMLGHNSIATTDIYVNMDDESSIRVMRALSLGIGPVSTSSLASETEHDPAMSDETGSSLPPRRRRTRSSR